MDPTIFMPAVTALVNTGVTAYEASSAAKANAATQQREIQFQRQQAMLAMQQSAREGSANRNTYLLIGAGVVVAGIVAYLALRKK